jgi:hypothetical protein
VRCATKVNFLLFVAFRNFPRFSRELSLKMLHATKRGDFKLVRDKEAPKSALCNEIELHDLYFAIFRDFSSSLLEISLKMLHATKVKMFTLVPVDGAPGCYVQRK